VCHRRLLPGEKIALSSVDIALIESRQRLLITRDVSCGYEVEFSQECNKIGLVFCVIMNCYYYFWLSVG